MVKINKVYTKSGDTGTTALGAGGRVDKDDPRVEAYGTVDEANACLGVAVVACAGDGMDEGVVSMLTRIQQDLFDVGADLCVPVAAGERGMEHPPLRVTESQTVRLEREIDSVNARLAALTSFVLPGGTAASAALHVARTVTRRAERRVLTLMRDAGDEVNPEVLRYLNRLSDLLFVLGRHANDDGKGDVLWAPGANRG